ncbi:hypothetical protein, no similarity [Maudiozyma barnettii]|uniref:PA14 domain-containing protein n=1 Tax=Maudiozyma barnettii TaxID=61262 RepID=A0A8H2VIS2_9SACH|nr:hypothetical protein, no similarity [Kazachstania barnettii]CAB4256481.1 hypothetical protein, no similarity [Kazachstania barnettii]CAD1785090.1 hypothetical protein, no similarity [Kazachstania barnettii]
MWFIAFILVLYISIQCEASQSSGGGSGNSGGNSDSGIIESRPPLPLNCSPTYLEKRNGLTAKFYTYVYPEYANAMSDEDFIFGGYVNYAQYLGTVSSVEDVNFFHFYGTQHLVIQEGQINGFDITISNFTVEYDGYFIPKISGDYVFTIGQTDDASLIEIYSSDLGKCCPDYEDELTSILSLQYYNNPTIHNATITLIQDTYYKFKIVHFNRDAIAIQTISFTDPNGEVHDTFDGYVFDVTQFTCPPVLGSTNIEPSMIATETTVSNTDVFTTKVSTETVLGTTTDTPVFTSDEITITETFPVINNGSTTFVTLTETLPAVSIETTATSTGTENFGSLTLTETIFLTSNHTTETEIVTVEVPVPPNETTIVVTFTTTKVMTPISNDIATPSSGITFSLSSATTGETTQSEVEEEVVITDTITITYTSAIYVTPTKIESEIQPINGQETGGGSPGGGPGGGSGNSFDITVTATAVRGSGGSENGSSPTGPISAITTVNNFKGTPNAYNDLTSQGNLGPHSRTLAAVSRDPKSSGTAVVSLADANIGNNLSIESMASATIFLLLNYLLL